MKKQLAHARASPNDPFSAFGFESSDDPWPTLPAREAGAIEWSKWLREFFSRFIHEWERFEKTWYWRSGCYDTGDAPDHLTIEPPGLFSEAAWAIVNFGDVWFFSSEKKPGPVEKYFRRIRDHIRARRYSSVSSVTMQRCLHHIENAVDSSESRVTDSEQPKTACDPPADPDPPTTDAGGDGQTPEPDGGGDDSTAPIPTPPLREEWSPPMSKTEMARRIMGNTNARAREVNELLQRYGLRKCSEKKWSVRLDTMDKHTREKVESS